MSRIYNVDNVDGKGSAAIIQFLATRIGRLDKSARIMSGEIHFVQQGTRSHYRATLFARDGRMFTATRTDGTVWSVNL